MSAGKRFWKCLGEERPLQVVGAINAYCAMLAQDAGFRALYVSGAGVANSSYGLPDLGMTTLDNVLEDVRRITAAVELPVLVDVDTGWGHAFMVARTVKEMIRAGAAAVHIEDQVNMKRCGHRPNKELVSTEEMCDRIKAAVDVRTDPNFIIMARTDAIASEGLELATERALAYVEAGADMIFAEAATKLEQYTLFKKSVRVPVLANITEFGKTPLYTIDELTEASIDIALYPLSASRAMYRAANWVYDEIRKNGSQKDCVKLMQTREELYQHLDYHSYEERLDQLAKKKVGEGS